MSQDKEREAFEAWWNDPASADNSRSYNISPGPEVRRLCRDIAERAWSAALATQQAGKGEPVAFIQCSRSPEDGYEQELVWHKDDDLESGLYGYISLYASPPSREPLTDRIPCRCFDERSRNLCLNKQRCYQVFGLAADGIHSREGESNDRKR